MQNKNGSGPRIAWKTSVLTCGLIQRLCVYVKTEESPMKKETDVKEESGRAQKKARKEASTVVSGVNKAEIEQCFKDLAEAMRDGFGMCLQEIKLLGDWM